MKAYRASLLSFEPDQTARYEEDGLLVIGPDANGRQVVQAIGREVRSRDVAEYVHFYANKVLHPDVAPAPLAYSVRRSSQHSPEGIFSIERSFPGSTPAPLYTLSRQVFPAPSGLQGAAQAAPQMSFALDASTRVRFEGEQHVHAYLHQSFSGSQGEGSPLFTARARQFSSFVLLLGKISSPTTFDPVHAVIVKNKDVLQMALDLAVIPTQKEFRDAISSLSR